MVKLNNTFAIGCLVQWYEIELVGEYVESLKESISQVENKNSIFVDFTLTTNQDLEKIDGSIKMLEIKDRFHEMMKDLTVNYRITDELFTIADYRRKFNDYYCERVNVLMWGETDSLIPTHTFQILDGLHEQVKENTPKYVSFFSTCKMWDESWKPLEHPDFTDKPFIDGDTENWWSLRYNMKLDEMNTINNKVEELDIRIADSYKFNGCGLVISSDVIKSGVNIPRSVFFIHEDTAFLNSMIKMFGNSVPQYIIKNILLVHNRKHPQKRNYINGESGIEGKDIGAKRLTHDWYMRANKMCEHNAYNMFNQSKTYTWRDVFDVQDR